MRRRLSLCPLIAAATLAAPASCAEPARTDAPLPKGAIARIGSLAFRQTEAIRTLVYSPDGKTLATGGGQTVYLWEAESGTLLHRLHLPDGVGRSGFAFSPDGKRLAVGGGWEKGKGPSLSLWDPATGRRVLQRWLGAGFDTFIVALRYSPDGRALAVDAGAGALLDADTLEVRRRIPNPWPSAEGGLLLWKPEGRLVTLRYLGYNSPQFSLLDYESKKPLCGIEQVEGWLHDAAVSPDGQTLALAADWPDVRLYDLASGKLVQTLRGHPRSVFQVAFSPDGKRLASLGDEDAVRLWDPASGKEVARIPDGNLDEWGSCLAFSQDGRTLAWASGGRRAPRLWDVRQGNELVPAGHRAPALKLVFSPRGDILTSLGADGSLIRWEFPSGRLVRQSETDEGAVLDAGLSPTGRGAILTGRSYIRRDKSAVRVVDGKDGLLLRRPTVWRPNRPVRAVRLPVVRRSPIIRWMLKPVQSCSTTISPDGSQFAVADVVSTAPLGPEHELKVRSFDVKTGKLCRVFHGSLTFVDGGPILTRASLVYSPDGRWLAGGGERMCVWDAATGHRHPRAFKRPESADSPAAEPDACGTPLAFTPDSRALLWRSPDSGFHLTELLTGGEIARFGLAWGGTATAAFSPCGRILAVTYYDGEVDLLDVSTEERLHALPKQEGGVFALAFSPDGKTLVTGCADTTLLAWDVSAVTGRRPPGKRLAPAEREKLFNALGSADADAADKAAWRLAADPEEAVRFVATRLRPVGSPVEERLQLEWLVKQLDDDSFEAREDATRRLTEAEAAAESVLRAALKDGLSPEQRRRAEAVLDEIKGKEGPSAAERWSARAVALLERIGNDEARKVLKALADGAPDAERTRDAQAALRRLGK